MWDSGRIGGGAVPIKTDRGWLELYHGATMDHRYCMGAVLLDLNEPAKVIARSALPILAPEVDYEKEGFFGDVVFSCGIIVEGDVIKNVLWSRRYLHGMRRTQPEGDSKQPALNKASYGLPNH